MEDNIKLDRVEDALEDFRNGKFLVVVDDEDRENEGDLIIAAEKITPEDVNFMLKNARGVLCAPVTLDRCARLGLTKQVDDNTSVLGTPFTVTVDKLEGCSTGVSIQDRAATIRALADPASTPETFGRPGHINPLYAQDRGVLQRAGRADEWGLKLISIRDLIAFRLNHDSLVEIGEEVDMPTIYGHFRLIPFRQKDNNLEHIALIKGDVAGEDPVLVRVHSSCMTGDIFGSQRCECGEQLHLAMKMIEREGRGAVVYLSQEGRGIGLMDKIKAYKLQENGLDTVDANLHLGHKADERDYGVGANILHALGIKNMRLMTNNPVKRIGLEGYGLNISEIVPLEITPNPYNERYMETKKNRMGHILNKV